MSLPAPILRGQPLTALAPMQDVTNLPFMEVIGHYEPPDYFFTEYFRVHSTSRLEPHILVSITENQTGRPVFAQMIGENPAALERTVRELHKYPIAGIDLNLGCPAPKVYKKCVGGGLLRELDKIDAILGLLRSETTGPLSVKTRIGFDSDEPFDDLLDLINRHQVDLLSVHGRTVKQSYRGQVHYDTIRRAAQKATCPVLANGNITSAAKALWVLQYTGAAGVMVGRSAIRNPWIFRQIRECFRHAQAPASEAALPMFRPTLLDVRHYIDKLHQATAHDKRSPRHHVNHLKKFLNFVGQGVDPDGRFLHEMRRAQDETTFFGLCDRYLVNDGKAELFFADEPYDGNVARPNCEDPVKHSAYATPADIATP